MPCTKLAVPRVKQFDDRWCGPACAQMVLLSLGLISDTTKVQQAALWNEIVANNPGFPKTETCGAQPPLEWATYPDALAQTLNTHIGQTTTHVIPETNEDLVLGHALASVQRLVPAIVLVEDETHWIVVFGCDNSARRPQHTVGPTNDPVTHVLVRDPANSGYPTRITLDTWIVAIYAVGCGVYAGSYVVVGAS